MYFYKHNTVTDAFYIDQLVRSKATCTLKGDIAEGSNELAFVNDIFKEGNYTTESV